MDGYAVQRGWVEVTRGCAENPLSWAARTDSYAEGKQAQPRHGIFDEIWPAGTEEGSARSVVLVVVA